jgi:hypothetical protein
MAYRLSIWRAFWQFEKKIAECECRERSHGEQWLRDCSAACGAACGGTNFWCTRWTYCHGWRTSFLFAIEKSPSPLQPIEHAVRSRCLKENSSPRLLNHENVYVVEQTRTLNHVPHCNGLRVENVLKQLW